MKKPSDHKPLLLAREVEEFFTMRCCDCTRRCDDGASDHCKVRYLDELAEGLDGLFERVKKHCTKCRRQIHGNFFIPDGEHEFCSIVCHTAWLRLGALRQRSHLEKVEAATSDVPPKRRSVLAGGDGGKADSGAAYNRGGKFGGCDD